MTDKTQPTVHAEITAPFSADLRRLPALSEQDAGLLEQAASMLEGLHIDERNRGNCSAAEGAACSADAVRRLAVQLLRSTETAQCLHQGAEPDKHMTIGRALREGLRAEPWISGGLGASACVGLCAIQLQGWWHTAETAKAYADAYNRGADDMRAALQAAPPAPAAVGVPAASEVLDALNYVDDFVARCNGDDRGSCASVNLLRAALAAAPEQEQEQWKDLGYLSEAEYAADMQAVGEALMKAIKDNYASLQTAGWDRPMDSPAEIVVDLLNLLDEAKAAESAQAQEDARDGLSQAARDVLSERARQVDAEGFNHARDDKYVGLQLAGAAASYLILAAGGREDDARAFWPWQQAWLKPSEQRRYLEKAGALVLAELERLDRASARAAQGGA